uniref:NADH dehydrogenase subunit 4 n=1 Tax=Eomenopon denticulatum TaxID=2965267 RepID=UPI0026E17FF4|nr:NADH dehydrogenase subunit 4 [Eomenopon denticulatum]WIM51544.1 NADH dehydrogenase subunit 4 [Eomenopon denticulatum]
MFFSLVLVMVSFITAMGVMESILIFSIMMLKMFIIESSQPMLINFSFFCDHLSSFLICISLWVTSFMILSLKKFHSYYSSFLNFKLIMSLLLILSTLFTVLKSIIFFCMFEVSMIPILLIIWGWGYQPERLDALFKIFFFTSVPSSPFLIYLLWNEHSWIIPLKTFKTNTMNSLTTFMIFSFFLVKMPMFSIHQWLPKAHVEAPLIGSMILASVLLKLGSYGLLRFSLCIDLYTSYMLKSLSGLGMLLSSLYCMLSPDNKSVVAYSSISHMNFMISSICTGKETSLLGSVIMMIAHAFTSSGLFFMSDMMYTRLKTRSIIVIKSSNNCCFSISFGWLLFSAFNMSFPLTSSNLGEITMAMWLVINSFPLKMILLSYFFLSGMYSMYLFYMTTHSKMANKTLFIPPMSTKESLVIFKISMPFITFPLITYLITI